MTFKGSLVRCAMTCATLSSVCEGFNMLSITGVSPIITCHLMSNTIGRLSLGTEEQCYMSQVSLVWLLIDEAKVLLSRKFS